MWNDGYSVKNIKSKLKISYPAVIKYLTTGADLGWCYNYTNKESRKRSSAKGISNLKNATPVYCKELNCVFKSQDAAAKYAKIADVTIGACCRGSLNTAAGMHWYYLYDRKMRSGIVVEGAITLGLITEEIALEQLNNIENKKNPILQLAC